MMLMRRWLHAWCGKVDYMQMFHEEAEVLSSPNMAAARALARAPKGV
jgi:hypothetical protein